jgi:uncharacterized protein
VTDAINPKQPAIVVTGASSGIGRELAYVAARERCLMVLVALNRPALDELAVEIGRFGVRAHALALDLADREAGRYIDDALSAIGAYCDVLVNCAGFGVFGPAAPGERHEQLQLLDVNVRALTELSLRFLPGMIERGSGGVLNVGSISGYMPGPNMATYFASKAYVASFTAALAAEVRGSGVTVTCLCPGIVRTAFFDRLGVRTRLFKLAPRGNAPAIAAIGWRGFRAGKRLVIPRLIDRIMVGVAILMPKTILLRLVAALIGPGIAAEPRCLPE